MGENLQCIKVHPCLNFKSLLQIIPWLPVYQNTSDIFVTDPPIMCIKGGPKNIQLGPEIKNYLLVVLKSLLQIIFFSPLTNTLIQGIYLLICYGTSRIANFHLSTYLCTMTCANTIIGSRTVLP